MSARARRVGAARWLRCWPPSPAARRRRRRSLPRSSATRIPQPLTGAPGDAGARPRHRRQPAGRPVPAVPQRRRFPRSASRATSRPTWPAPAPLERRRSCACASSTRGASTRQTIMPAYYRTDGLHARRRGLARQDDARRAADRGRGRLPARRCVTDAMTPHARHRRSAGAGCSRGAAALAALRRRCGRRAQADELAAAVAAFTGGAPVRAGQGQARRSPRWSTTATSVPVTVSVDSPMTAADHVTAIAHLQRDAIRSATWRSSRSARAPARRSVVHAHPPGHQRRS